MLKTLQDLFKGRKDFDISPVKNGHGWLSSNLPRSFDPSGIDISQVRKRAELTRKLGEQPLWEGYKDVKDYPHSTVGNRTSDQVRTAEEMGAFYVWLTTARKPEAIVEFGTAFGISGMYWLTGLSHAGAGTLFTYEPNVVWAKIAQENLRSISARFVLTMDTFEANAEATLSLSSVDMAFIDAIHTSEFVYSQYDVLRPYLKPDGLVLFDDINFSPDMAACWNDLANRNEVLASYELGRRVGIIELKP